MGRQVGKLDWRDAEDRQLAEGVPEGAGIAVMDMIGCGMYRALRTTGFVCICSSFIFMPFSFDVIFFRKDVLKSFDSMSITDTPRSD